jgi:hypothetical protein
MTRRCFGLVLLFSFSLANCRSQSSSLKDSNSSTAASEQFFDSELVVSKKYEGPALPVLKLLMGVERSIVGSELQAAIASDRGQGGEFLSFTTIFRRPFDKPVSSPVEEDAAGEKFRTITLYQGTGIGPKIYILYSQFTLRETEYQKDTSDERLIRESSETH